METHKIKRPAIIGAVILLLVLSVVFGLRQRTVNNPLDPQSYKDIISGTNGTIYVNKGLEVQSTGPSFVNTEALQTLGESRADDTLAALKQFVTAQSHYESRVPVITDVHKNSATSYGLTLFLDSSEQFYDITVTFNQQQIPNITAKVDTNATL